MTGSSLAIQDSAPVQITAARLDVGSESTVTIQVAGILSFVVLEILAFHDRRQNKDAYDLIYSVLYFDGGPEGAAGAANASPIRSGPLVGDAMDLLGEHFETIDKVGPRAYAAFVADGASNDTSVAARRRAQATVAAFLALLT